MTRFALRTALLLTICAAALLYANHVPAVAPSTAPPTTFSAERAMAHVRQIAARPHPIGSAEQQRVIGYIAGELASLGVTPEFQDATAIGTRYTAAGRVRNIVARVPGSSPGGPAVLLMAHHDGVPAAPGAGDDASGSAVLLETLRALRAGPPLLHDIIVLFADGEESGLLGAAAFVREHRWAADVAVTMNVEARGTRGPSLMFETGPGNLDVVRALRSVGGARATSLSTFVYRQLPNDTDISETARLGKPALNFAFIGGVNRYHTAQDDTVHLDPRSVQDHGDAILGLAREFAGNPLPRAETGDAVFFDVPLFGLVVYPERLSPLFAFLILVPLGFLVVTLRRHEPRWLRGILLGAGGVVATLLVGGVLAVLTARALQSLHASIGSGSPTQSGIYVAAVALLGFTLASAMYSLLRRWAPALPLHAGGAAFFALIGLVTSGVAPSVSFVFVWPALFVIIALARSHMNPVFAEASLWVATALAAIVLVPITYLMGAIALGLDATGSAVIVVFTVLGAWLLAHTMELWAGHPWRTTAVAGAASLLLFCIGAVTVRTSAEHPVGSSFGYGVDADSNSAYLGVQAGTRGAVAALRAQLAAEPSVRAPAWFGRYFSVARAAPPPGAAIPRARVSVVGDSVRGDSRQVTVRIVPGVGTRAMTLRADSGVVRSSAIDGRVVDTTGYRAPPRGRWMMEYYAPPDAGFDVAFTLPPNRPITLTLVTQLPGIPRVPGLVYPTRPDGVIPIQRGDFTLVHQRVEIP